MTFCILLKLPQQNILGLENTPSLSEKKIVLKIHMIHVFY